METMRKFTASLSGLATMVVAGLLLSACGDRTKPMPTAAEPAPRSAAAKTAAQPAAPTNFRAATVKTQVITLTWDAGAGAAGYKVQKRRASWNEWENAQCQENDANKVVAGTTCTAGGLRPDSEFSFRVRSWASSGAKEDASAWVELASPVSTYPRLSAPTAVSGSSTAAEEITVTWTAAAGEADRVVGYRVQRQQAGKSFWKLADCTESGGERLGTSGTTCTATGLKTGVQYRFQVKAHGDAGHNQTHSAWSQPSALITADVISFANANLESVVRRVLGLRDTTRPLTVDDMASLIRLQAAGLNIQNLAGLEHCTALDTLYLHNNQITDVSRLSGLTGLQYLNLWNNQITDVSGLSGLTNLDSLYLNSNQITDVSGLSGLTDLIYLNLQFNSITDMSGLSGLTGLQVLDLDGNSITDMSGLPGLTGLKVLDLANNSITDVSGLSGLTGLISLGLSGNSITDVSGLSGLTSLGGLDLTNNSITDVSELSGLTGMQLLLLGNNSITDVSGLSGLTILKGLELHNNSITDVSGLSGLTDLIYLDLSGNSITDVSGLSGLTDLIYLDLQDYLLSEESKTVHIPALIAAGVPVLYDP